MERIGRLRINAWSTNNTAPGFITANECWLDEHDADANHWIASIDEKLVGSARLCVRERLGDLPDGSFYEGFESLLTGGPVASFNRLVVAPEARHLGLADIFDAMRLGEALRLGINTILALVDLPLRLPHLKQLGFEIVGESRKKALRDVATLVLVWRGAKFSPRDAADHAIYTPSIPLDETGWCAQVPSKLNKEFIKCASDDTGSVLDIGGGIGLVSIEALRGGSQVVFNDVEPKHIQAFSQKATAEGLCNPSRSSTSTEKRRLAVRAG